MFFVISLNEIMYRVFMNYETTFYWRKDKDEVVLRSTKLDKELILQKEKKEKEVDAYVTINSFSLDKDAQKDKSWRDEQNNKLNERHHIIQRNVNPFINHDYTRDIETQKMFLTPKDSNVNEENQ